MEYLRKILYEEKVFLGRPKENAPLNMWLYDRLVSLDFLQNDDEPIDNLINRILNDAYFLCTLVVDYYKSPYKRIEALRIFVTPEELDYFKCIPESVRKQHRENCHNYASVVLVVTYCLLYCISTKENDINLIRTIRELDEHLRTSSEFSQHTFETFQLPTYFVEDISIDTFYRRELNVELLESIDWKDVTRTFDISSIMGKVNLGRSKQEKLWILDAIEYQEFKWSQSLSIYDMKYENHQKCSEFFADTKREINEIKEEDLENSTKSVHQAVNHKSSLQNLNPDTIYKCVINCGPYRIVKGKQRAFMSVIWTLHELHFFEKSNTGQYSTNRDDVISNMIEGISHPSQQINNALKTDTFMNVFNEMQAKATELYSK